MDNGHPFWRDYDKCPKIICLICGTHKSWIERTGAGASESKDQNWFAARVQWACDNEGKLQRRSRIELNIPVTGGRRQEAGRRTPDACQDVATGGAPLVGNFTRFMWPINVLSSHPNCRQLRACVPISVGPSFHQSPVSNRRLLLLPLLLGCSASLWLPKANRFIDH